MQFSLLLFLFYLSQSYKHQGAFIITQGPMQSTARDFWKMVHDRKCGVIVMLSDLVEGGQVRMVTTLATGFKWPLVFHCLSIQEVCYQYWPSVGLQRFGEFTVELLGE